MIKMNVSVDLSNMKPNLQKQMKRMQVALDTQVLKDSNYYAPQTDGALITSSLIASQIGSGILMWDMPYARRLYYNPQYNFSTDRNPNARGLWFEAAKAERISEWVAIMKKVK